MFGLKNLLSLIQSRTKSKNRIALKQLEPLCAAKKLAKVLCFSILFPCQEENKMNLLAFCLFLLIPQFEFRSIVSNRDVSNRDFSNRDFDLEEHRPCVVFRDDRVGCSYNRLLPHPLDCNKVNIFKQIIQYQANIRIFRAYYSLYRVEVR